MLFTGFGRSVLGETVPFGLSTQDLGHSFNTDRPKPVNNIYIILQSTQTARCVLCIDLQKVLEMKNVQQQQLFFFKRACGVTGLSL